MKFPISKFARFETFAFESSSVGRVACNGTVEERIERAGQRG